MERAAYRTSIEESVLQSRGPHRIETTTELVTETVKPGFTVVGEFIVFGETEYHGGREPRTEQKHQEPT
jgi:hypothetical protein